MTSPQPARIDFFGDEVDSIRLFDPYTQRSTGTVDSITIPPARETLPSIANEERVQNLLGKLNLDWCGPELQQRIPAELGQALRGELTDRLSYYSGFFTGGLLFDYLPDDSLLVVLRPTGVEEAARSTDGRLSALRERKERRGEAPRRFPLPHIEWGFLADSMSSRSRRLDISPWGIGSPERQDQGEERRAPSQDAHGLIDDMTRLPLEPAPLAGRSIERALELAGHGSNSGRRYVFMTNHALRVADVANERGLNARVEMVLDETPAEGAVRIVQGHLRQGFTLGGKPGEGFYGPDGPRNIRCHQRTPACAQAARAEGAAARTTQARVVRRACGARCREVHRDSRDGTHAMAGSSSSSNMPTETNSTFRPITWTASSSTTARAMLNPDLLGWVRKSGAVQRPGRGGRRSSLQGS